MPHNYKPLTRAIKDVLLALCLGTLAIVAITGFPSGAVSLDRLQHPVGDQTQRDSELIAAVVILESSGEGDLGMQAVANVIVNRAQRNGISLREVVKKPRQFAVMDLYEPEDVIRLARSRVIPYQWERAKYLAVVAIRGSLPDITEGALYFHSGDIPPDWASTLTLTAKIGRHSFYR